MVFCWSTTISFKLKIKSVNASLLSSLQLEPKLTQLECKVLRVHCGRCNRFVSGTNNGLETLGHLTANGGKQAYSYQHLVVYNNRRANQVWGRVMFLLASVILSTGGVSV